jgi:hypothetical protein
MAEGLVIGTLDIETKDQMVLRALVRLLEGGVNIQARFSEQLSECNVVFVPGHSNVRVPDPCVPVRVFEAPTEVVEAVHGSSDLCVTAPLRMSNVMAVLQAAMHRMHRGAPSDPQAGLHALFRVLAEHTPVAERRRAAVPLAPGQQLVFDFVKQLLHTAAPMEELLTGVYTPGTPHRVTPVEEELIRLVPAHSLRQFVWNLASRLARSGAATPQRTARYRLLRWPDAAGLTAAGHPRLAALLTSRSLTLEQLKSASGAPDATVRWFLEACLALGLAVDDSEATAPATPAPPTAAATTAPGWLSHLRERLKLW